jgi:hypothetical protein
MRRFTSIMNRPRRSKTFSKAFFLLLWPGEAGSVQPFSTEWLRQVQLRGPTPLGKVL